VADAVGYSHLFWGMGRGNQKANQLVFALMLTEE